VTRFLGLFMLTCYAINMQAPSAIAQVSFTPFPCSTSAFVEFNWDLDSLSLEDGYEQNEHKERALGVKEYHNNIKNVRHFYASRFARYIDFHALSWNTESCCDSLSLKQGSGAAYPISLNTASPFWTSYSSSLTDVLQYRGVDMTFLTDNTVTKPGFRIDKVRIKCQSTAGSALPFGAMRPSERYTGVLMAQNDVVNFQPLAALPNESLNIVLWGPPGTNRDIDLYVKCSALPTPVSFTVASINAGSMYEFVRLRNDQCADPFSVNITVHNKGSQPVPFNIMVSEAKNSSYRTLRVAVEGGTATDLTNVRNTMRNAVRQFYGLTEGQMLITEVVVTAAPGNSISNSPIDFAACRGSCGAFTCDICFYDAPGSGGNADTATAVINIGSWLDGDTVLHEMHHSMLGLNWDEFNWNPTYGCETCGHSISQNAWSYSNNLCIENSNGLTNHPKDVGVRSPSGTACTFDGHVSGWAGENQGLYTPPGGTPDIYDFASHAFLGAINVH